MQDLIIVCEDIFGLNVLSIVDAINSTAVKKGLPPIYRIKGFLLTKEGCPFPGHPTIPTLGTVDEWTPSKEERFAMGAQDPSSKEASAKLLKDKDASFVTLKAPWVLFPEMVFGEGCVIATQSIVPGAVIRDFVTLFYPMVAEVVIDDYSTLLAYCNATNAHIGKRCFLKSNTAVMLDQSLCDDVSVLPNSVVFKSIKKPGLYSGIPARKLKEPIT